MPVLRNETLAVAPDEATFCGVPVNTAWTCKFPVMINVNDKPLPAGTPLTIQ
jgi:hypothetical protein